MQPESLAVEFVMPRVFRERRLLLGALALGVLFAIYASGLPSSLTLETLRAHRHEIVSFVSDNRALSAFCFVAVYVVVVALALPSALLLTLSGGFLFGAVMGSLLTVIGATLGASLLFLFARTIIGENGLQHFGTRGAKLACAIRANAWTYLIALRLLPLFPFFLVNIIPALAGVRLRTFVATTFIGIFPATFIFSLSGAGLGEALDRGGEISLGSFFTPEIIAALGGLGLLALASIPLKRKFARDARTACRRARL